MYNLAVARPGHFTSKKFNPSMQTNWMNYDVLLGAMKEGYSIDITTIGFSENFGADRVLEIAGIGSIEYDDGVYRTKTQQAVTGSVLLDSNDNLLDGVDALLMPFYTFFEERCYYFTLAYLAAEAGVPVVLWDTDSNFILQVAAVGFHFSIEQARDKVFKNPVYINEDLVRVDIINKLDLHVLSPCLEDINFRTYFPFFPLFDESWTYNPRDKKYEVVYAGSQYDREELFLKYYDTDMYDTAVCGKYSKKFLKKWKHSDDYLLGHISRLDVQEFLATGDVCVQIARKNYNRIGHVTPRVYEVVDSGTLLLVDSNLKHGELIVGEKYVVSGPEDVVEFLEYGNISDLCEEQAASDFMVGASPYNNADILAEILRL